MGPGSAAGLIEGLAGSGWAVLPGFLGERSWHGLEQELRAHLERGDFREAGIGRGASWRRQPTMRGDHVQWIERGHCGPCTARYLARMEHLRRRINRALWLGLFDFEAHFTRYPPAARYRRHVDQFAAVPLRTVSVVTYLNRDWQQADGGALRLHPAAPASPVDISPVGGTLVAFLSAGLPHEVLPSRRERLSITGWFTRRP